MARGKYQEWLNDEGLLKLQGWARDGLTDEQIATNIGIRRPTLYDWENKYSDISDALKRGKEVVDRQVENSLLKRAMGYQTMEQTKELTDNGLMVTKEVTKQVPPDTTAAIFWLKNRKPDVWRDRKETQLSGSLETNSRPLEKIDDKKLSELERKLTGDEGT